MLKLHNITVAETREKLLEKIGEYIELKGGWRVRLDRVSEMQYYSISCLSDIVFQPNGEADFNKSKTELVRYGFDVEVSAIHPKADGERVSVIEKIGVSLENKDFRFTDFEFVSRLKVEK